MSPYLQQLHDELNQRLIHYPTRYWGCPQQDEKDNLTAMIYQTHTWQGLMEKIAPFEDSIKHYAVERWYNFHAAQAAEAIFKQQPNVKAASNRKDKQVDFYLHGIPFDLKMTVIPKNYPLHDPTYRTTEALVTWYYENQSKEGRYHTANRLFMVFYRRKDRPHSWQLKARLDLIQTAIVQYVQGFDPQNLVRYREAVADKFWVIDD